MLKLVMFSPEEKYRYPEPGFAGANQNKKQCIWSYEVKYMQNMDFSSKMDETKTPRKTASLDYSQSIERSVGCCGVGQLNSFRASSPHPAEQLLEANLGCSERRSQEAVGYLDWHPTLTTEPKLPSFAMRNRKIETKHRGFEGCITFARIDKLN